MEQQTQAIEEVYCPRCFLATPVWRMLCIHCRAPLGPDYRAQPPVRKVSEKMSEAA